MTEKIEQFQIHKLTSIKVNDCSIRVNWLKVEGYLHPMCTPLLSQHADRLLFIASNTIRKVVNSQQRAVFIASYIVISKF